MEFSENKTSQNSVETLFDGKTFFYFVTNLFRTLCVTFYQNWPSFVEDITKIWVLLSLGHGVYTLT